ncbi:MAG: M20/M25/M40 family metallo-hydrolase, partial [Candidatus Hydrogenedentes bacterium]|nr:M20/M25/M40 family metallo-hydrolase [Candidatus Hydrogenedentota bacterium]
KISMRLVADQEPAEIRDQLCAYLEATAPKGIEWEVRELVHGKGAIMDRKSAYIQAAMGALRTVFNKEPVFKREGGSVPIVGLFQEKLGVDSVMLGFALPDDGIHGPNERQYLPNFFRGIDTYIHFMTAL